MTGGLFVGIHRPGSREGAKGKLVGSLQKPDAAYSEAAIADGPLRLTFNGEGLAAELARTKGPAEKRADPVARYKGQATKRSPTSAGPTVLPVIRRNSAATPSSTARFSFIRFEWL